MKKLVRGLSGWLTFQQVRKSSPLYSEVFVYQPIFEIASSLGWEVIPQLKIEKPASNENKLGRRRTFDFAFFKKGIKRPIVLEVKFSKHRGRHDLEINKDVKKFNSISKINLGKKSYSLNESNKFILLISGGGKSPTIHGKQTESNELKKQVEKLIDHAYEINANPEEINSLYCKPYGWSIKTPGSKVSSFCVMVLKRQGTWKALGKLDEYLCI